MASHTALSYIRYSVQKRNEEKESPEIQRRVIAELAKKHDCEILQEYSDLGISGESIFKREGIQRLMADLRRLQPDYIICQHQDRLGRSDDLAILKIEMRKYNVGIITSQGVIDLSNPYEDVMSDILGAFAKFERQMGSLRARELRKNREYLNQLQLLKKEIKEAEKEAGFPELEELMKIKIEELWDNASTAEHRRLLGYLIEKVIVYPEKVLPRRLDLIWKAKIF